MSTEKIPKDFACDDRLDKELWPLMLQNKTGTMGCILKNTFYFPYKKPRLPFGGMSSKVHGLLRPLKIAHTMMVREFLLLEDNLPDEYHLERVLYTVDKTCDYWLEPYRIGKSYFQKQTLYPFLADGFVMARINPEWLHLSFDLTPFYPESEYPDYSGYSEINKTDIPVGSLKAAAAFYNEYVGKLFESGFLIMPTFYTDALAGIYSVETISENAIIVEI